VIEQRLVASDELSSADLDAMRALFAAAWEGGFSGDDWDHTFGGLHVVRFEDDEMVSHGAVAERTLWIADVSLRVGYLEAVATSPGHQGRGHGSAVVEELDRIVRESYELGGLSTGRRSFYERLGWLAWCGPLSVRTHGGDLPTPFERGGVFVLPTPRVPNPDLDAPLVCDERSGDDW
jgi:aminoglycoside 2'-N-acetyltransferase I